MVVKTTTNAALAAAYRVDPGRWSDGFGALLDRIAPRFARYEPLRRAGSLMLGLLSGMDRKNCWTIASIAVTVRRMGCSTCCPGRSGTPTRSVMICVVTCPNTSLTRPGSWWSMRPGM